jgi:hypothetical protein
MRFVDIDGSGRPHLIVAPLMGRNSTQKANWTDGSPVRILAFKIPKDPTRDRWVPEVIDESLHVVHNFWVIPAGRAPSGLFTASYEGVKGFVNLGKKWNGSELGSGNQTDPKGSRGSSEVKVGNSNDRISFIGTIEPWHGHQVVVYTPPGEQFGRFTRNVIDENLKWGHAVWTADLDAKGKDDLIIGVRDDKSEKPGERRGVRLYKALDEKGTKWARHILDDGGIAVEDLAAADLDGDGRIDIVAVGRQTHNIRIYWNKGK